MSWYKCNSCGHIFEGGEERMWNEPSGEPWSGCPCCGGGFDEAKECKNCGGVCSSEELYGGLCETCAGEKVMEYKYDYKSCFFVAEKTEPEKVDVNAFLASIFTPKQIEEILLQEVFECSCISPVDCEEFINGDLDWFFEKVLELEEVKQ